MRIEGNGPNPDAVAARRLERALNDESRLPAVVSGNQAGADRVELSADAALAGRAVKAAEEAPEIRAEVVERARRLLEAGKLGSDAQALADRLIESMKVRPR